MNLTNLTDFIFNYIEFGIILNSFTFIFAFILSIYQVLSLNKVEKIKLMNKVEEIKADPKISALRQTILFVCIPFYGFYLTCIHLYYSFMYYDRTFKSIDFIENKLNQFKLMR